MGRLLVSVLWWIVLFPTLAKAEPDDALEGRRLQISKLQLAFRKSKSLHHAMEWVRRTPGGVETPRLHSEFFIEGERMGLLVELPQGKRVAFGATNGDLVRFVYAASGTAATVPGVNRLRTDHRAWNRARRELSDLLGVCMSEEDPLQPHLAFGPTLTSGGAIEFEAEISVNTGVLEPIWLDSSELLAAECVVESEQGDVLAFQWPGQRKLLLNVKTGLPVEWAVYDAREGVWVVGRLMRSAWTPERWRKEIDRCSSAPGLVPDYGEITREGSSLGALVRELTLACDDFCGRVALYPEVSRILVTAFLDQGPREAQIISAVREASRRLPRSGNAEAAGQSPCIGADFREWIADTLMDEWSWEIKDSAPSLPPPPQGSAPSSGPLEVALRRALRIDLGKRIEAAWRNLPTRETAR